MTFLELCVCNKDWAESTNLIICSSDSGEPHSIAMRPARSLYGYRKVLWFRECVVMLE